MKTSKQIKRTLIAAFVLIFLLAGVKFFQIRAAMKMAGGPPPTAVSTFLAKEEEWKETLTAVGELAPVQGAILGAEESGKIARIVVESGASVHAGDPIIELDTSVEQAELTGAQAQAELAKIRLTRAKRLRESNANSVADLDEAEASYRDAVATVETLKAKIARKTIIAPFAGKLGIRRVNEGQIVSAGTEIISLQSFDSLYVNFSLPQQDVGKIAVGQNVKVSIDSFTTNEFEGTITAINPDINQTTRTVAVQATLTTTEETLKPGMFANITVILPSSEKFIILPQSAINYAPYGNSVFVVEKKISEESGKEELSVRQQVVQLGPKKGDLVGIISGIKPGEEIVSAGTFRLRPGAPVMINNSVMPGVEKQPVVADT